jgi:hypothetical protein
LSSASANNDVIATQQFAFDAFKVQAPNVGEEIFPG